MAYKSQTRERCQVSAVLIVRENNCERAWVSATLGCRAVRGVTSQLGRQGSGASSAGERLRHPTNDRMAPLCQQADGHQPLTWQLDTYRGSEAFLWADWVRQEDWIEWVRHCRPFWGFQGFPHIVLAMLLWLPGSLHLLLVVLKMTQIVFRCSVQGKSRRGMKSRAGGVAIPDGMNSTGCKLLSTAAELKVWSLLDSRSDRYLHLLNAIN